MSGTYVQYPAASGGGSSGSQTGVAYSVGALDGATANNFGGTIGSFTFYQQSATAAFPGVISSGNQTLAGVKTFSAAPIFSSLTVSSPVRTDSAGALSIGSTNLAAEVVGNLPLAQTSGSLSLVNQVTGNLPLAQTSGSLSLVNRVVGNLPLSQTSGSLSLVNQVAGNLPLTQTSGSLSLTNQVSGILPFASGGTNSSASYLPSAIIYSGSGSATTGKLTSLSNLTYDNNIFASINANTTNASAYFGGVFNVIAMRNLASGINPLGGGSAFSGFYSPSGIAPLGVNPKPGCEVAYLAQGGGGQQGLITFSTKSLDDDTTNPVIRMVIGTTGNVTIGSNSGTAQFQTNSTVRFSAFGVGLASFDSTGNLSSATTASSFTTGSTTQTSSTGGAAYTIKWPGAQGGASTVLANDSAGNLSWSASLTNPMTVGGDMIIGSGGGAPIAVSLGSTGYNLFSTPGVPGLLSYQDSMGPVRARNYSLAWATTGGNLRLAVVQPDGTKGLTAANPAAFTFRGQNANDSRVNTRFVTGSLSLIIEGGINLGIIGSSTQRVWVYAIDLQDGLGGVSLGVAPILLDESKLWTNCAASQVVTLSVGTASFVTPAGVTGITAGMQVSFTTQGSGSGALPSPLALNTIYYTSSIGTTTFTLSNIPGGPQINTSGSQLGVHKLQMQNPSLVTGSQTTLSSAIKILGSLNFTPNLTVTGSWSAATAAYVGGAVAGTLTPPVFKVLSSGSFIYYPTYSATYLKVTAVGGGGGGGSSLVDGAPGAMTTFGSGSATVILLAGGGGGGIGPGGNSGGASGSSSGGDYHFFGGGGGAGISGITGVGGNGGVSMFGGSGLGGGSAAGATSFGRNGAPNTGAGGGGACISSSSRQGGGAGGGVIKLITSPAGLYNYTIGDGGVGSGSGGYGGSGVILIEEGYT